VFSGRVFRYPRGDLAVPAKAEEYGRSVGVPEAQLDWPDKVYKICDQNTAKPATRTPRDWRPDAIDAVTGAYLRHLWCVPHPVLGKALPIMSRQCG
jgi:hypothetical protein